MRVTKSVTLSINIIFANARKESLMKNKKQLTLLSVILATSMLLGACNQVKPNPSSSNVPDTSSAEESSSSEETTSSSSSSSSQEAVTLVSITVTAPTKTAYTTADTALDLTGMVVTANYSNQTTQVITTGYTVSQVDFSTVGEKTVTVTYEGKTDTFTVTVAAQKFTVKFVVDGVEVQTGLVEEGQTASYTGQTPTKAADANAVKYRVKGWDKDLSQPITQDTTFTAQFAAYAGEVVVDDFESYTSNGDLADNNWVAIGWKDGGWSEESAAYLTLGTKSDEGNKALRLNAWRNGSFYKIGKKFPTNTFDKSVNALKFRLMVPANCEIQVILYASVTINGQAQAPAFYYPLTAQSGEYVEYTLPLDDSAWDLWNQHENKSIASVADWTGIHQDDIMSYLTKIEIAIKGTVENNLQYAGFLDSMRFVTVDNPVKAEVETMGQYNRYTGLLNDGHTVKVELGANGAATATIVDMETPLQIPGNVAVDANKNMTFTSADNGASLVYKAALKNGGQYMKFVEASGTMAQGVQGVDLNAVQVVDNFEQYDKDGQAYYQSKPADQRSGCRGAYYSEYCAGGSASSPWGGATWSLLGGDGSQLKLKSDNGGHNGSKNYLCVKHSKSVAFRYMQWGLFDGTADQNAFRGSKFSFWAKTNGYVNNFKVSLYSQNAPTNQTKDSDVRYVSATPEAAIGEWTQFTADLNPDLVYYGYMIFTEKNTSLSANEAYLYIDDVEVYTANPYAKYEAPVVNKELVPGNAYLGKVNGIINATLRIKSAKEVSLTAAGLGMALDGTYSISEDELTMSIGGATYKATISEELDKLTFASVNGSTQVADALNNLSFDIVRGDNIESYTETGRTIKKGDEDESKNKGSSGAFYIDMYKDNTSVTSPVGGSKWDLTGSGAGAALNKEDAVEGSQSLKLLNSGYGNMRYIQWDLYKGTAKAMTGMTSFSVYLKNFSADTAQTVTIMAYRVQKVDNGHQGADYRTQSQVTLPAGQGWTKYTVALDASKTYYGFALLINSKWNQKDYYVGADAAFFSNVENDPSLNFYAKNGLVLSGKINANDASITFGQNGAVTLNCAALGGDLAGTYEMAMDGANQMMTIKTSMGNITGTYAISAAGVVTFVVTAVTGDLAAGVNVGATLSNQ